MEVVYSATGNEAYAHDLNTGALLSQFEDAGAPFVLTGPYVCSIKNALLYVHVWGQKAPVYRASLPEKLTAIEITDGIIVAGGVSGKIYIWHTSSGTLLHSWAAHYKSVTSLTVRQNWLVSGAADGQVLLWEFGNLGKSVQQWSHALPVTNVKITPGPQPVVVSSSLDHTVKEWDLSGPCIRSHTLPSRVLGLAIAPGQIIAYGDGLLTQLGGERQDWQVQSGVINSASLNLDGCMLATSSVTDRVRLWDTRTRQSLRVLKFPTEIKAGTVACSIGSRSRGAPMPLMRPLQRVISPLPESIDISRASTTSSSRNDSPLIDSNLMDWSSVIEREDALFSSDLLSRVQKLEAEVAQWRGVAADMFSDIEAGIQ